MSYYFTFLELSKFDSLQNIWNLTIVNSDLVRKIILKQLSFPSNIKVTSIY